MAGIPCDCIVAQETSGPSTPLGMTVWGRGREPLAGKSFRLPWMAYTNQCRAAVFQTAKNYYSKRCKPFCSRFPHARLSRCDHGYGGESRDHTHRLPASESLAQKNAGKNDGQSRIERT